MPAPPQTVETESRRSRGFALYFTGNADGTRRSLRSIAQELGVVLHTVQYWRAADKWDERIRIHLAEKAKAALDDTTEIKVLMRDSLISHIRALNDVIVSSKRPSEKIRAIKEFVEIYKKLGIPLPDASVEPGSKSPTFKDDIPHEQ